MSAKDELAAIVSVGDWAVIYADRVIEALHVVQSRMDYLTREVIQHHWEGESATEAAAAFELVRADYNELERGLREVLAIIGNPDDNNSTNFYTLAAHHASANYALRQAREAYYDLPSPVVPREIRAQVQAALNDGKDEVIIDNVARGVDGALSYFEGVFGNREEKAAQAALEALRAGLRGPASNLANVAERFPPRTSDTFDSTDIDGLFDEVFDSPPTLSNPYAGMGGPSHSSSNFGGSGPTPPANGGPIPPGGGGPKPPGTGGPDPAGPYPPYVPGGRDDYISVDDGSTGWQSRGLGAGAMGVAGVGGALAARSSLANSGPAAGAATPGQGGLLGTGAGGAGVGGTGAGGAGAGGLGAGGRSGAPGGMMGGQGGKGGSEKDKKPSLNGYMAPKLEDDDAEFTPLPDSARAGGRDADAGGQS